MGNENHYFKKFIINYQHNGNREDLLN